MYDYSKEDVVKGILIPLCDNIGFWHYQNQKESIIKDYYKSLESLLIRIQFNASGILSLVTHPHSFNNENNKQVILLELLDLLSVALHRKKDSVFLNNFLFFRVSNIYREVLNKQSEYYKMIFLKIKDDNIIFDFLTKPITFKEFMQYVENNRKEQVLKEIEELIDQLYEDTYVQYFKETQQEKDNLMELLHL